MAGHSRTESNTARHSRAESNAARHRRAESSARKKLSPPRSTQSKTHRPKKSSISQRLSGSFADLAGRINNSILFSYRRFGTRRKRGCMDCQLDREIVPWAGRCYECVLASGKLDLLSTPPRPKEQNPRWSRPASLIIEKEDEVAKALGLSPRTEGGECPPSPVTVVIPFTLNEEPEMKQVVKEVEDDLVTVATVGTEPEEENQSVIQHSIEELDSSSLMGSKFGCENEDEDEVEVRPVGVAVFVGILLVLLACWHMFPREPVVEERVMQIGDWYIGHRTTSTEASWYLGRKTKPKPKPSIFGQLFGVASTNVAASPAEPAELEDLLDAKLQEIEKMSWKQLLQLKEAPVVPRDSGVTWLRMVGLEPSKAELAWRESEKNKPEWLKGMQKMEDEWEKGINKLAEMLQISKLEVEGWLKLDDSAPPEWDIPALNWYMDSQIRCFDEKQRDEIVANRCRWCLWGRKIPEDSTCYEATGCQCQENLELGTMPLLSTPTA